jgi:type I phosphodiesterase/nucleotide pyrophosphatase
VNPPAPPAPRYGTSAISDLVPSLLAALGLEGFANPLGVEPLRRACLLVIDGLGWELVKAHPKQAPFLSSLAADASPLTAGFPSSTSVSLSSIGTGMTPGEHGVVGYTMAVPGLPRAMNVLRWTLHGPKGGNLLDRVVPEDLQPEPTAFERAVAGGVSVSLVGPVQLMHTGMTRAVLRGGRYRPAFSLGDLTVEAVLALEAAEPSFVYAYNPDLDATGHVRGVDSEGWRLQLAHADRVAAEIASRLPPDSALVVTGDHGMVDVKPEERVEMADRPDLRHGVRFLGGEPRARHVYARPGAAHEVLAAWREGVGDRMWVLSREEAITAGWFGPYVSDAARPRIGDVVAAAFGPIGVVEKAVASIEAKLIGHHGSLTKEEQLVPFLIVRR